MTDDITFLPEYSHVDRIGGCYGLYRLFSNASWRMVHDRDTKKVILFKDAAEAIKAAKEVVRGKLNPPMTVQVSPDGREIEVEQDPDILGMKEFFEKKRNEFAEAKSHRTRNSLKKVVVEYRGKGRSGRGAKAK